MVLQIHKKHFRVSYFISTTVTACTKISSRNWQIWCPQLVKHLLVWFFFIFILDFVSWYDVFQFETVHETCDLHYIEDTEEKDKSCHWLQYWGGGRKSYRFQRWWRFRSISAPTSPLTSFSTMVKVCHIKPVTIIKW